MKRLWQDTLFKRLFVLMWVALVVSHVAWDIWIFLIAPTEQPNVSPQ